MSALNLNPHQTSSTQNYHNYTDVGALNDLKRQAREDQQSALRPVAEQFEALFVQQVLKEARKVTFDDGWLDGDSGDFYKDWYDKQLSQDLSSKGTLGFADKIVEQLTPKNLHVDFNAAKRIKEAGDTDGESQKQNNNLTSSNQNQQKVSPQVSTTEQILSLRQLKP